MVEIKFEYDGRTYTSDTKEELLHAFMETYIRGDAPITAAVAKKYVEHIKHFGTSFGGGIEAKIVNKLAGLFNAKAPGYSELLKIFHAYGRFRLHMLDDKIKLQLFDIALKDTDPKHLKQHIAILNAIHFMLIPPKENGDGELDIYMNLVEQRPEFLPVLADKLKGLSVYEIGQLEKNLDKYYKKYPKNVAPVIREWYQTREQVNQLQNKSKEFRAASKQLVDNFNQAVMQRAAQNTLQPDL